MANNNDLEKRLWQAADQLWANSSRVKIGAPLSEYRISAIHFFAN